MMLKKVTAILLAALVSSSNSFADTPTTQTEKMLVIKVKEMNCQLCAYLVNKELRDVEGVKSTKASISDNTVKVVASNEVQDQALIKAIDKLHYSAEILEQN